MPDRFTSIARRGSGGGVVVIIDGGVADRLESLGLS